MGIFEKYQFQICLLIIINKGNILITKFAYLMQIKMILLGSRIRDVNKNMNLEVLLNTRKNIFIVNL